MTEQTVTMTFPNDIVDGPVIDAFDGCIGYWARIMEGGWDRPEPYAVIVDYQAAYRDEALAARIAALGEVTITEQFFGLSAYRYFDELFESDPEAFKPYTYRVDRAVMSKTLADSLAGKFGVNGTTYAAELVGQTNELDHDTSDVLIQLATLGELTYG